MNMHDEDFGEQLPRARPVYSRPGGKTRMLKYILPLIPEHTTYVEPFFGGGAVFFAKEPSHHEVINDIDKQLVEFNRSCKYHLDPLLDEMDLVLNARQEFEDYLQQPGLTEIQRAARWFIKNRLSFGGMGSTFAITRTQPLPSRSQRLIAIRSLSRRLDRTTIENRSWEFVLETYDSPEAFLFLDPPYFDSGGAAYAGWDQVTLQRFANTVTQLQGKWLVTFQDCEEIRELFAGHKLLEIERANGIGNRAKGKRQPYREVIITNEREHRHSRRQGKIA